MRRAVTRKITTLSVTRVRHPPFGHHGFATRQSFVLPRVPRAPARPCYVKARGFVFIALIVGYLRDFGLYLRRRRQRRRRSDFFGKLPDY